MDLCGACNTKFELEPHRDRRPCSAFAQLGYAPCWRAYVLTDAELSNASLIRDGRNNAFLRRVPYRAMLDYLTDLLRDFRGVFVDRRSGKEVSLDMSPLEDAPIDWFRDLVRPCPDRVRPRTRVEARERWRSALTILRATAPEGAYWGRVANDHSPHIPSRVPMPRA